MPNADITFSSEIRALPRFYELSWKVGKRNTLRLGKIWIPFDNTHPHQTFGGIMNTNEFNETSQFMPDLWADMGIGLKFRLVDRPGLKMDADVYLVNGFGDAGAASDPLSDSTTYPNFFGSSHGQRQQRCQSRRGAYPRIVCEDGGA